jgi:hypothetical protein
MQGKTLMRALALATALIVLIAAPALACGPADQGRPHIPTVAAAIDRLLPASKLPKVEIEKVKALRAQIVELMAAGKEQIAREVEEQAMRILGYEKIFLKCGPGTFSWMKVKSA